MLLIQKKEVIKRTDRSANTFKKDIKVEKKYTFFLPLALLGLSLAAVYATFLPLCFLLLL